MDDAMKPARAWRDELAAAPPDPAIELIEGRGGEATLRAGKVFLHSRYRPEEEAARLIDAANLNLKRPILVVGLGLGYHVAELLRRGADEVAVVEPDRTVAKYALDATPLRDADLLLGIGEPDAIAETGAFIEFARRAPQLFIHPPTARIHPEFAEAIGRHLTQAALGHQRLHIAIVGPMYGGSLPIAGYLDRAFRKLGHETCYVDNSAAWDLYGKVKSSVKNKQASNQLGTMLTNYLSEWSYARVSEFAPDICIAIAQAPVNKQFPLRLMKQDVVTAFWYVENWRHLPYWKDIAACYDYFFHIQPGEFETKLDAAGCRAHAVVQTGCDPELHRPVELSADERREYECDLSFAGAGYYNRIQMFRGLLDYHFKIWGVSWGARELQPLLCRPEECFSSEQFTKVVAGSKINLNLHSSAFHDGVDPACDAINPRVYEIAACGGFQLCDPCVGLDGLYDFETELPVYRDLTELRAKIDYFLAHPEERAEFAARARARALRDHTYEKRAQQMLDLMLERYGARILRKGIRVQRTMAEVADRVGRGTPLGAYLESLQPDLPFTHENINAQLAGKREPKTHPEQVFTYLREVREFADKLFEMQQ
ncbi:MAG: hypothetical protein QG656_206 [Candidatus Hydrogenedentes bacterium]|nr:hypothetical protein [Candidatus Hydrogenedentota bacterium]